ncbi:hypothetical protein M422DRAFT_268576 [Sphaerobolus stellatus SS14]|uniref:Uncharacterized protein n=1 Tax=Sphaerobolus stellatus (strain SS14) TaxID=990650 RepID=A0A0C9UXV9_SPHS4|nr:hypothetical protein M422DRAFT_268576 [Sphaerobolus stellatus SS14]
MNDKRKKNNTTQLTEAHKSRWNKPSANQIIEISDGTDSDSDVKCTGWQGGVCHVPSDSEDSDEGYITILDSDEEEDCDLEFISGEAVIEELQREWRMKQDLEQLVAPTVTEKLMKAGTSIQWAKVESNRTLGYNGLLERTRSRQNKQARDKSASDKVIRESIDLTNEDSDSDGEGYCGYLSELSDGDSDYAWEDEEKDLPGGSNPINPASSTSLAPSINFQVCAPPPLKCQKLDVPAREALLKQQEAWVAIQKLITSKKDLFESGRNSLQEYRARAIESCLQMMVKNGRKLMDASERAAESLGFAKNWGGRMVRSWVRLWITSRELPTSKRGRHSKVFSLLDDPLVCTKLWTYLRSNKWSMNLKKLVEFTKNKLLPDEAKRYLQYIVKTEMPSGLKMYLELELFPRIQVKVSKGISLRITWRWLHKEGFKYTAHKKALYFDGHKREDPRLVKYIVGDVDRLVEKPLIPGEPHLVLVAHDEMTAQAHDGVMMSWVWQGEQLLKKKGAG